MLDVRMLLVIAEAAVDDAEAIFLQQLGAAERVAKGGGDFATTADLEIEQLLRTALTQFTGIPVYGEEGGGEVNQDAVWVVDPIDGTSNYAVGNPMCAILVSLLVDARPVLAICSMPALGKRVTAYEGGRVVVNGQPAPSSAPREPAGTHIGFGSLVSESPLEFGTTQRQKLLSALAGEHARLRITGSVGVDLAFAAVGTFAAAVSFSPFTWDNAAGVLLCQTAGLHVTDLQGKPWTPESTGVIAGNRAHHELILRSINRITT